jgi:ribose transport system permease protein
MPVLSRILSAPWVVRLFIKPPLVPLLMLASFVDGFWSLGNWRVLLESIAVDGMIVAGLTLVMIAGGFDLAVGAILAMGGVAAVVLLPFGLTASALGATTLGGLAGIVSGLLVTRLRINPFIATLAVMVVVRGAILAYTGTRPVVGLDDQFLALGEGRPVPYAFIVMALLLIALHVAVSTRPWGRHLYAVGADPRAAAMAGLKVQRIKMVTYALSGVLAGLAGLFLASRLGTGSPIIGDATPLTAAAAALIGGATLRGGEGSIPGAFCGLLFMGALVNVMNLLEFAAYYQQMTIGALLIALVASDGVLAQLKGRAPA